MPFRCAGRCDKGGRSIAMEQCWLLILVGVNIVMKYFKNNEHDIDIQRK